MSSDKSCSAFLLASMRVEAAFLVLSRQIRENGRFFEKFGCENENGRLQEEIFRKELSLAQEALERRGPFRTAESLLALHCDD